MNANRAPQVRGFTLIELMVAVAVIGLLFAIAMPSYHRYVQKSHRSRAQSVLMQVAQKQGQLFLDARSYSAAANAAAISAAPINVPIDANLLNHYGFAVTVTAPAGAPPTFTVTATPTGGQTSDSCSTMTINQAGVKTPATGCW